ncbi:MAG TPA: hypothetical protein VIS06_10505 [Mycobacteriales bacterium]
MADFEITADGLSALNAAIISAAEDALPDTRKALQVNAQKVRDDARRFASGLRHAPLYPYAITYDTRVGVGWAEAVIGPDKDRPQGALGNILEYGTTKNPPYAHLGPALDRNTPDLVRGLGLVIGKDL